MSHDERLQELCSIAIKERITRVENTVRPYGDIKLNRVYLGEVTVGIIFQWNASLEA